MKKISLLLPILLLVVVSTFISYAQTQIPKDEIVNTVPELDQMHEIIFPIWHEAYPDKDYKKLRSYLDEVLRVSDIIIKAKLPGILREKQAKWDIGIQQFKGSVEAYKNACNGTDDADLLLKAEKLHSDYEMLVRIVKPLMKEVGSFHESLYIVYHDYLPNNKIDMVLKISDELISKAELILKGKMPKKIEAKKELFIEKVNILINECKNVKAVAEKKDSKAIGEAIEKMHTAYSNIEELFG